MSIYVLPPTPQTVEGFADKIGNAWEAVFSESPRDDGDENSRTSIQTVFPALGAAASYKRPWLDVRYSKREELQNCVAAIPQPCGRAPESSEYHHDRANKSLSEPPAKATVTSDGISGRIVGQDRQRNGLCSIFAHIGSSQHTQEGSADGGTSESSMSADEMDRTGVRGRGRKASSSEPLALTTSELPPKQLHVHRTSRRSNDRSGTLSPGGSRAGSMKRSAATGGRSAAGNVDATRMRTIATSKSESHIAIARFQSSVRLPKVESAAIGREHIKMKSCPKRRGKKRDLRLPPPGGYQNAASNGMMKEMEAQIACLRSSPQARRVLEARVSHHLSRRSKRYDRRDHQRRDNPVDDQDVGDCCDKSFADGSAGAVERWGYVDDDNSRGHRGKERSAGSRSSSSQQRRRAGQASHNGWRRAQGKFMIKSGKSAEAPGVGVRMATQTLRAQAVLRRKRAIEDERSKQCRERSALMEDENRRPRDKKAEKKRAEALITIVTCAICFAEWKLRFEERMQAKLKEEQEELAARALQRVWRMNRIRRTLAQVRASTPGVRSIVFSIRSKAAAARKVVAKRHQTQAADLIRAALRAGTRTLFRTRISYYRERIVKCQRLCTSYREITKARKRALTNKWTRHVHKLDERRFSMYSAHLRDMYNFDPIAVECFLKEMRLLAARGQTAAQAMKSRPFPGIAGIGNINISSNNKGKGAASNIASTNEDDHDDDNMRQWGQEPSNAAKNEMPQTGGVRPREPVRSKTSGRQAATTSGAASLAGNDDAIWKPLSKVNEGYGPLDARTLGSSVNDITKWEEDEKTAPKRVKVKLAAGWQKRVVHVHSDVEAQASLMSRRGVKHKEISRALRNVLIKDLLDSARREHRNWCWNYVRAIREKERQTAVVDLTDIRSVLRTDSISSEEGTLEAKIKALTTKDNSTLPFNRQEHMHLMTMITDDLLMRCIILAERIEGCVAADGSGCGSLSLEELREIFVVNRHPNQHENAAAKEVRAELQAWAKDRGLTLPIVRRGSTTSNKAGSYQLQQKTLKEQQAGNALQVPYFDFMSAVKGGILSDICVPEGQRLALRDQPHSISVPRASRRHV